MNPTKKDRQALRRRLIHARTIILVRQGWKPSVAKKMARDHADRLCAEIRSKEPLCPTNE